MNTVNLIVSSSAGETWLDLYDEQPIKLTFNLEDATSLEPKAEFTRGFRVPGTDKNFEFFSTIFEVAGTDFNPGQKYPCRININGNDFRQGELRLQNVLRNDVTGKLDYQCVFLGNVKSLASEVGEKSIAELDWDDYSLEQSLANVTGSWEAAFNNDDGLFDGDVIFPLVDFGNVYDGSIPQESEVSVGGTKSFTTSGNALGIAYWRPMVRIREIMRRIFEQNGFTLAGNFFTENVAVKNLYASAFGNTDDTEVNTADSNLAQWAPGFFQQQPSNPGIYPCQFTINVSDPGNNLVDGGFFGGGSSLVYEVPAAVGAFGTIDYTYYLPIQIDHREGTSGVYTFRGLTPQASAFKYVRYTVGPGTGQCAGQDSQFLVEESTDNVNWVTLDERCGNEADGFDDGEGFTFDHYIYEFPVELEQVGAATAAGQYIYSPQISISPGSDSGNSVYILGGGYAEVTRVAGQYSVGAKFKTDYKIIDFIKDIFTMFRLLMIPDPDDPTKISVIPWNDYIGTGVVKDWSNKLNKDKDVVIRPLILDQTDRFTLEQADDGDYLNEENKKQQGETFGTKKLDSVYDILKGETKIATK